MTDDKMAKYLSEAESLLLAEKVQERIREGLNSRGIDPRPLVLGLPLFLSPDLPPNVVIIATGDNAETAVKAANIANEMTTVQAEMQEIPWDDIVKIVWALSTATAYGLDILDAVDKVRNYLKKKGRLEE